MSNRDWELLEEQLDSVDLETSQGPLGRVYRRHVALENVLREARPYVFNRTQAVGHDPSWREQTAVEVLARIDAVLAVSGETLE